MGEKEEDRNPFSPLVSFFTLARCSTTLLEVGREKIECGKLLPVNASVPESCCNDFAEFEDTLEQLGAE